MKHILKLLFLLAFAGSAFAQLQVPGMLDRSFGRRGVVTELPAAGVNYKIYEVLTQPDGKMIAVGRIVLSSSRRMFMLVRYNRNGTRDWTFGNQGMSAIWFGMDVFATSAALQPDGKIIVAGVTSPNAYADFAMARYLPDGDLDMSFGQGGIVTTDTSTFDVTAEEWAEKVFVLPDGRMLLVGTRQARSNFTYEQLPASMMVARYLPDGSLDPSYGIGGKSIIPMELLSIAPFRSALVTSDGHVAITCSEVTYVHQQEIKRADWTLELDADGSLERNFGQDGRLPNPNGSGYLALKAFPNGDLLMADNQSHRIFVWRPDGQIGSVVLSGNSIMIDGYRFWPVTPLIRPDGRFVSVGYVEVAPGQNRRALARFYPDGTADPSYGIRGISFGPTYSIEEVLSLQSDGSVMNAANMLVSAGGFNLVRYSGDPQFGLTD